jgi:DNA mismatch endonuclease (patch repair protein)
MGLRYRVHRRPLPDVRRQADIVFAGSQVAVFVHGCFWHGCPSHATLARTNRTFWSDKIATNRRRDEDTCSRLLLSGWMPMEIWEHEDPHTAAMRIAAVVSVRCAGGPRPRKRAGAA